MTVDDSYVPPKFQESAFTCPFCRAFTQQDWGSPSYVAGGASYGARDGFQIALCRRGRRFSVWIDRQIVHPDVATAPNPNPDLSADVLRDYEEARSILNRSARGAAALLRLAIQKICRELGEPGENINDDIASLVKKGLPAKVQKALDTVRVVGNNAVHPGQINLRDDPATAALLFGLVNLIADVMISQPKHVDALYDTIVPEASRKAVAKRDGSA